jgi:uncharacterized SAM-binding protein YcdF (DUF218 family)
MVAAYVIVAIYPVSHAMAQLFIRGQQPFKATDVTGGQVAVVLLGSGSYIAQDWDGREVLLPNRAGAERVVEAARIYRLVQPKWVISSGGRVYDDDPSSASAVPARDLLIQLGVPETSILIDNRARNTHEESVNVGQTLKALGPDHVVIVTSDIHMRRAQGAFRAQGIETVPAIARRPHDRNPWGLDFLPSDSGLEEASSLAREILGITYYSLRGWYRWS